MYKILFERNPRLQKDWPCPVCLANCSTVEVVVETGNEHIGTQELARCHSCRSWFFLGAEPVLGYQHEDIDARYWFHYVQVGAGIDFMLRPLMALGSEKRGQLLDVGCGFGFVPDFWSRSGRGRGVGLEAAEYGKAGRELLGVELYSELIDECEAIRGTAFDIVYSSEVIEHVRDPRKFLAQLSGALAAEGILVLTTPSAGCVREDFEHTALHAALFPGFHYFLLSKSALETLLEQAGLPYFFVIDTGDRLIAWASKVEFCAPDLELFDWDAYLDYLNDISKCADPHLRGGALYRLFKDSLNTGRHERVSSAFTRLEEILKKTYGMDLTFPNVADVLKTKQFLDCLDKYPAWLGATLFFGGIYVGNCLGDIRRKLRLLEASTHVLGHSMAVGFQFAQEAAAFLPVATYNYRIALAENLEAETPQGLGMVVADPAARPSKDQISTFRKKLKTVHSRIAMNLQSSADRRGRAKKPFKNIKRWLAKPGRWRQRA